MPNLSCLRQLAFATILIAAVLNSSAQTATWTNIAGGNWNTAANWTNTVPALGLPVAITNAGTYTATYNAPMTPASISGMTLSLGTASTPAPTLAVSSTGLNVTGTSTLNGGAVLSISSGGVMTNSTLNIASVSASVLVNGGTITNAVTSVSNNGNSDGGPMRITNGAVASLGNVTIRRSGATAFSSGLSIWNSTVSANNVTVGNVGANSFSTLSIGGSTGSVVNVAGNLLVAFGAASARQASVSLTNGTLTVNGTVSLCGSNNQIAWFNIANSSSVFNASGIVLFTNAIATPTGGTVNFTNAGTVYLGAGGISLAGSGTYTLSLNNGGLFGASADWAGTADAKIPSGNFTFQAADALGTARNITYSGIISGAGALTKTGTGTLLLNAAETYSGNTYINAGTLAVGAAGSLNGSLQVIVASNAVLDVSQAAAYTTAAGKTLAGFGVVTGNVAFASGAILNPGTNLVTGTLTFSNNLTQTGGAINHFDLSSNPSGPNNDLVIVGGDVNVSGVSNIFEIAGGGPGGSVHPLIKYGGTFNGDVTNFVIVGPTGYLTNDISVSPKMIAFVVSSAVRSSTNTLWVGNSGNNIWDSLLTTNWLNAGQLDYFVTGDNVTFGDAGQLNSNVNLTVSLQPGSVTVNATGNYVFSGAGNIAGLASLTKTNAGRLTILNTNQFTGGINHRQGTITVASLADDNTPSPLGQSGTLLLDGGTLEYTGANYTWTRSLTFGSAGGTLSVPAGVTLTSSGSLVGGSLIKADAGALTLNNSANTYSGGTVLNAGTLTLNAAAAAGSGAITLNAGNLALAAVKPLNTINVAGHSQITGGNSAGNTGIRNVTGTSNLLLVVSGGTTFDLTGDMTAYSGTLTLSNGGGQFIRFNGTTGSGLATWNLGQENCDLNIRSGSTANYLGGLQGGPSTTLSGRGGSANNGPTTFHIGGNGLNTTFDGVIRDGGGGGSSLTSVVKTGGGTLTLSGVNTYSGTTVVSNGVLALTGSGTIAASSSVTINSGAALDASARGDNTFTLGSGQTLRGDGTVRGNLIGSAGSTISPGAAIGVIGQLTVTNALTLNGALIIDLNRTNGVMTNDVLAAANITYGGTLTVTNRGPNLVAGDRFVLFSGPVSGSFTSVNLPENLGTVTYTWTNNLALDGSIQVLTAVTVNQTPTNIVTSVSGSTLTLSWPSDRIGWRLQAQTNTLATGLNTNWADVAGSSTTNVVNQTIDSAAGAVFYRLVYP